MVGACGSAGATTQRPIGMSPCAAIVAATRAMRNGEASTSPWPYDAQGSRLFEPSAPPSLAAVAISKASAVSFSVRAPTAMPSCAK